MAEKITHSICVGGPLTIHTTEDGVIRRVRPIVFDETDPAGWVIKARGKEFTPPAEDHAVSAGLYGEGPRLLL